MRSFIFLLATIIMSAAGDWPQFRGPRGNGVSDGVEVPTNFTNALAWQINLPGEGLSSPIIIGDRLFVTCSGGLEQQTLHVLCFKASDGTQLWERKLWATGRTVCHDKTSVAAPTPASDGKHIVALFSSSDVACLDLEGNLIWLRGLGRDYPGTGNSLGMSSSLVIADGVVVAQVESASDSFAAGLDIKTGANQWKIDRPRKANWTSPCLIKSAGKTLVTLQSSQGIVAVEPSTGKTVWTYSDGTASISSSTPDGEILYVPSHGITALQGDAANADPKRLWRGGQLRPGTASIVVLGDKVFALNDGGVLTCGEAATGNRSWQLRMKGPFSATPVTSGKFLFCVNEKGLVQVVDTTKPEGEVISELDLAEKILSTPSVANGAIYFRSDTRLWRFGKS